MSDSRLHPRLSGLGRSPTVAINERSNALRMKGQQVYKLGLGQSPFPVLPSVVSELQRHAEEKDYLPTRGLPALREAIAAFCLRRKIEVDPKRIVIGPGSKELLFLTQLAHRGPLLIPQASWVSYEPQAKILGKEVVWIPTDRDSSWKLQPAALDTACRGASEPGLLILNYPSNPTGASFDESELRGLAEVARRHELIVIADEIYGELHHRGEHRSLAEFYPEGTVVSSGLSKWCGAGGWRLGYFAFPAALDWLCEAVSVAASETFTSVSAPIQYAAVRAFGDTDDLQVYLDRSRKVLAAVCDYARARLEEVDVSVGQPCGGFYLFADIESNRALARALRDAGVNTALELCERLLGDTGVAVLPGSAFGRSEDELCLRLAYVNFDGGAALAAAEGELGEAWVRSHCPELATAMGEMSRWLQGFLSSN